MIKTSLKVGLFRQMLMGDEWSVGGLLLRMEEVCKARRDTYYHNLSSALVNFSLLTGSEEVISKA